LEMAASTMSPAPVKPPLVGVLRRCNAISKEGS
jgi:hypothetical protein